MMTFAAIQVCLLSYSSKSPKIITWNIVVFTQAAPLAIIVIFQQFYVLNSKPNLSSWYCISSRTDVTHLFVYMVWVKCGPSCGYCLCPANLSQVLYSIQHWVKFNFNEITTKEGFLKAYLWMQNCQLTPSSCLQEFSRVFCTVMKLSNMYSTWWNQYCLFHYQYFHSFLHTCGGCYVVSVAFWPLGQNACGSNIINISSCGSSKKSTGCFFCEITWSSCKLMALVGSDL